MELVYFIVIGAVAGWLASKVMGLEAGLLMTTILGIVGGFVGGWGFAKLGLSIGGGLVGSIIVAALGAVVVIWIYKLMTQ